ncbi:PKD domain-containing protein [Flavobacterium pectinovorum]|uniref:PKD domain-containing protein n=1 Tax=Flavobacterium pectinovorum TaxID=29533 RepID=A0AB36P4C9_9FLAO|nr:PKD domain-containing protein [Flavobacterium pectinovorum]OXB06474.1 PKD domain-containing protein [Flavobacterium pectinovorum]SHL90645.1 PKD domain-containing protein [Flavobacterium pectinovorum]
MKNKFTIIVFVVASLLSFSCGKDDIEKGLDCVAESIYVKLHNKTDETNIKKMDYSIEYSGTYTLKSVKWNFGDGTPAQTVTVGSGTTTSISHIYAAAGTYTVKVDVSIQNGNSTCTSSPTRSITVN